MNAHTRKFQAAAIVPAPPAWSGVAVTFRPSLFHGELAGRLLDADPLLPTIAEIVATTEGLSRWFAEYGEVRINGHLIPREIWHRVRPRYVPGRETIVSLEVPLRGGGGGGGGAGGGGGGKNPIATIASIAVLLVAAAVSGGALGLGGIGFLSAGAVNAIAGATVAIGGALAVAALVPPPKLATPAIAAAAASSGGGATDSIGAAEASAASLSGNVLSPGASVPRVVGTMRVFPPFFCNSIVELVGELEYAETVMGLRGPHDLDDLRAGDTAIAAIAAAQVQIVTGRPNETRQSLIQRYGFAAEVNAELAGHVLDATTQSSLKDQTNPGANVPQPQPLVASTAPPDEIWLTVAWVEGLVNTDDATQVVNQAFRIQFRRRGSGDDFANLPEIHFSQNKPGAFKKDFRLIWGTIPAVTNPPPSNQGAVFAYKSVPGQSGGITPATAGWTAHARFSGGAGNDLLSTSTAASSNVRNVELYAEKAVFYLDEATFPKDCYEFLVTRSVSYKAANFAASTYTYTAYATAVFDLFFYSLSGGVARLPLDHTPYRDRVTVQRIQSIKNENPIQTDNYATISLRFHSRALNSISVLATGLVPDWDGAAWSGLVATSNCAAQWRDVLTSTLGANPQPTALIRESEILTWRQHCIDNDYTVNMILEGRTYSDALNTIASCGFARWRHNEKHGVFIEKDRSGDAYAQVFDEINSNHFRWKRLYATLPTGIRANFVNAENNYDPRGEIIVYADETNRDANRLSQFTYDGLVYTADVELHARFDQAQPKFRFTFYSWDTDAECITCERGDLVGVQHDTLTRQAGRSRVLTVNLNGAGLVAGLTLQGSVPVFTTADIYSTPDVYAVDWYELGLQTGLMIRLASGAGVRIEEITATANGDNIEIAFVTPFAPPAALKPDCLVAAGPLGFEFKRMIVFDVAHRANLEATITAVDEAPELLELLA